MASEQLNMLTQMLNRPVQKQPSVDKSKNDDKSNGFKDMLDKKNQTSDKTTDKTDKTDKQEKPVKGENNDKKPSGEKDISQNQAMLAHMLFGQLIKQPVQNMNEENVSNQFAQNLTIDLKDAFGMANTQNSQNQQGLSQILQGMQQVNEQKEVKTEQKPVMNKEIISENADDKSQGKIDISGFEKAEEKKDISQFEVKLENVKPEKAEKAEKTENVKKGFEGLEDFKLESESETDKDTQNINVNQLFKNVEATPVKVGEAPKVLDTNSPDMEQKLKDIVKYNLQQSGDKIEIQLNPSNLGKVTVELTQKDGALSVLVTAENSKAMNILSQHAGGLENILKEQFSQPVQVYVEQQNQHHEQSFDGHNGSQQQQQRQQEQKPDKDEQSSFVEQLRLGLIQV